jgi:transposase-like protein
MKILNVGVPKVLKRLHYPLDVMLTCVRRYVAYPLSLRHLEEMMAERGISIDDSTVHRWAIKLLPVLAGLQAINAGREMPIKIRQAKYLNNIVAKDHRAIKRIVRPMLGFKDFRCTRISLGGIELMHMIAKGQKDDDEALQRSIPEQFYGLAT